MRRGTAPHGRGVIGRDRASPARSGRSERVLVRDFRGRSTRRPCRAKSAVKGFSRVSNSESDSIVGNCHVYCAANEFRGTRRVESQ